MNKLIEILAVATIYFLFRPINLCYSQTECPHFKIAESVEGERIAYMKPIKCVELDLINNSDASNILSYDIDNDGFDERISYRLLESKYTIVRFKIEGQNPNGGIIHEFDVNYHAGTVGDLGNGVWLYLADIYGDALPELLAYSFFEGDITDLTISIYSDNRFIDINFPYLGQENTLYIKNQKLVRDYTSNGKYKSYALEQYNLKIKNNFSSSWEVYVNNYYCGVIDAKKTKTFRVPINIYQKITCKQYGKKNPIELSWTKDKKPLANGETNCNIDTYFLQITNTHSDPRNVYVDGYYFGQVPGKNTKRIEVITTCYRKIKLEQAKGYLMSPNIENFTLENRPNASSVINIKN